MKNIIIYLSLNPDEGGKFQYSISLLEDLSKINNDKVRQVIAVYTVDHWKDYLYKFSINGYKITNKESKIYNILRKIIFEKLSLVLLWRKINKYFSKRYKQLKGLKPDIIFYPGNDTLAYEFDFKSIIPIFDLMHRYENFPEVKEPSVFYFREKHYKNICKYATSILVDSELGKKHVLDCYKVDEKKIFVYPYKPPFYVKDYIEIDVIKKYNLPEKFFFYPAQFWKHKNHKVIIEAVKILKDEGLDIYFVFVGAKKNGYDEVVNLIKKYQLENNFYILGYVSNDELVSLYKRAIALVFPSFFGPTNIPPLEALALGCPIVVSDVYAHREQLKGNAKYFNPLDPLSLSKIIKELYYHEKNDISKLDIYAPNILTWKILIDLLRNINL